MSIRSRILLPIIALAAFLAGPAGAEADTFCVNKAPCLLGTSFGPDGLQDAIDAAEATPGNDTVTIGTKATPYVGNFHYDLASGLTIQGAGPGSTILEGTSDDPVLDLAGVVTTVRDLEIHVPSVSGATGLRLGGLAENITIEQIGSGGIPIGLTLENSGRFEGGTIETTNGAGADTEGTGAHSIRDSAITSTGAAAIRNGFKLEVSGSVLEGHGIAVETFSDDATLDLDTTVVRTDDNGVDVYAAAKLTGRHVTIVRTAPGDGRGLAAQPFGNVNAPPTTAELDSSVISGFDESVWRSGTVSAASEVTLRHSAWDGAIVNNNDYGFTDVTTGNLPGADAGFVDPVADLRLADGSALIDAADPAEAAGVDIAGTERPLDGDGDGQLIGDIGAFEHATFVAPPPPAQPSGETPGTATALLPKRGLKVRGGGKVKIRLSCPAGGGACSGTTTVLTGKRTAGAAAFTLAAGETRPLKLKLAPRAKASVKRRGSLRARVLVTSEVAAGQMVERAAKTKLCGKR